ncbi:Glycine-zipper containing OmpA-like membrane domain-containing protein [Methylomagnum ishizawai]|uniref:Glycine-zipper containing OmpA-like membrane domain-containing protein n=1 Tax=Methylomagnum ishizawai TaxID=1760988 RepID=A0A1Y6D2W0_9GAMM|nr:glycine zipper domain-containing protein [Methylomagnum ishizawai]SMF94714.1 Glycine-zipper containing OmpA-like membrane domain-containing protein [Methylomagnum ishizawai]
MANPLAIPLRRILALLAVAAAVQAEPIVYPAKGQSAAQTAADKSECQGWATQQTGVNPAAQAQAPAPAQSPQGGLLRGGAKGAAAGAAIGAVAGDAGKGAAIGAVAGGMGGAMRRHGQQQQQQAQAQQAQAQSQAQSQAMANFDRAYSACLKGRGYSVE